MIRLNDDYFIIVDEQNYGLCRDYKRPDKNGKPTYRALGYFGRLNDLMNYWIEFSVKNALSGPVDLSLADAVNTIKGKLEECKKIVEEAIPDISVYPNK